MKENSVIGPARTAGLLYLVVVATGIVSLGYVPSRLMVSGDANATVANIAASQQLFRLGIAAGLVCYTTFLLLPLALHRLLGHVDATAATLMVALAATSVPLALVNMTHKLEILTLLDGAAADTLDQAGLVAAVMLCLDRYANGITVVEIFWGLWLLPFGYLVYRSRMLPRVLGVLLMLGCFGYLTDVFATTLSAAYPTSTLARYVTLPASLGEIGTCVWLLVFGARNEGDRRN